MGTEPHVSPGPHPIRLLGPQRRTSWKLDAPGATNPPDEAAIEPKTPHRHEAAAGRGVEEQREERRGSRGLE